MPVHHILNLSFQHQQQMGWTCILDRVRENGGGGRFAARGGVFAPFPAPPSPGGGGGSRDRRAGSRVGFGEPQHIFFNTAPKPFPTSKIP